MILFGMSGRLSQFESTMVAQLRTILRLHGGMQIFVTTLTVNTITLDVEVATTEEDSASE